MAGWHGLLLRNEKRKEEGNWESWVQRMEVVYLSTEGNNGTLFAEYDVLYIS